jgi:hypothetical protein
MRVLRITDELKALLRQPKNNFIVYSKKRFPMRFEGVCVYSQTLMDYRGNEYAIMMAYVTVDLELIFYIKQCEPINTTKPYIEDYAIIDRKRDVALFHTLKDGGQLGEYLEWLRELAKVLGVSDDYFFYTTKEARNN